MPRTAIINGFEREIIYTPSLREDVYNINEFSFSISPRDTLLVSTVNKGALRTKQNEPINAIGKMMVFRSSDHFNLYQLFLNLGYLRFTSTVILSINLRDDIKEEVFQIKEEGISVTYVEMGINYFIKMLNENPARFFILNKKTLYIFRDSTYSDINSILRSIGSEGLNLVRGSNQKSHVVSTLELRFFFYLLALKGDNYRAIMNLNSFDELPKSMYLPTRRS